MSTNEKACNCKVCDETACRCAAPAKGNADCRCKPRCGCEQPCSCNGCGCCSKPA